MPFIIKEAIKNSYERYVKMLDSFDDAQIFAIYKFISGMNRSYAMYDLWDSVDRVTILHYLICLKLNENWFDEEQIFRQINSILYAMCAMVLLKNEYNK